MIFFSPVGGFSIIVLLLLAGVALDWCFGELPRWHPLVGFGLWAMRVEKQLNCGRWLLVRGWLAWLLVVLPILGALCWLSQWLRSIPVLEWVMQSTLLYFCLGLRSLREHNLPIMQALQQQLLPQARILTSRIVSRDTATANASDLAKASVESLLENGNDAVFATLFWFVVGGAMGALLYRLSNTLDAMWGYQTARFNYFGRTAARIDDVMNWLPARLTALSYVLLAVGLPAKRRAWLCWRTQATFWPSPNAGPVMASGAGALGLALGGDASYHGQIEHRPRLGLGRTAEALDIGRAWHLVVATTVVWLAMLLLIAGSSNLQKLLELIMEVAHA